MSSPFTLRRSALWIAFLALLALALAAAGSAGNPVGAPTATPWRAPAVITVAPVSVETPGWWGDQPTPFPSTPAQD